MKRIITLMALLSVVALTGCKKDPAEPVKLSKPTLTVENITANGFTVRWDAVSNAQDYTVILNSEAEIQTELSKVYTNLAPGTYTIKVKANAPKSTKEFRDSDFAETTATIVQPETPELTFTFNITEVTETSALLTVTPSDPNATYYFDNMSIEEFETFSDPNDIRDFCVDFYVELGAEEGLTPEESMEIMVSTGVDSWRPTAMVPGGEYLVFAFGVNIDGTYTTDIMYQTYQTLTPQDKEREPEHFDGDYYGQAYSDAHNYYIHLSSNGFDDAGYAYPNSWVYTFDLYGAAPETLEDVVIPAGTYTLDLEDTFAEGTFAFNGSFYWTTNDEAGTLSQEQFESGTLVVTENGITAELVIDGMNHTLTYEGSPSLGSYTGPFSNLTGDVEADLSDSFVVYASYGDDYGIGATNYAIQTANIYGGDTFFIEFNSAGDSMVGTYEAAEEPEAGKFIAGSFDGGSWYELKAAYGESTGTKAPLVDGTITISYNEADLTHTLVIDVLDDLGNRITANYTGLMQPANVAPTNVKGDNRLSIKKAPSRVR